MKIKGKSIGILLVTIVAIIVLCFYLNSKNEKNVVNQKDQTQIVFDNMWEKMNSTNEYIIEVNYKSNTEELSLEINNLLIQTNQVILTYSFTNNSNNQMMIQGISFHSDNEYPLVSSSQLAYSMESHTNEEKQIAIFTFDENIPTDIIDKNVQFNLELGEFSKTEGELDSSIVNFEVNVKNMYESKVIELDKQQINLEKLYVQVNSIKLNQLFGEINYTISKPIPSDYFIVFSVTNEKGEELPIFNGDISDTAGIQYFDITADANSSISVTPQLLNVEEDTVEILGDTQVISLD